MEAKSLEGEVGDGIASGLDSLPRHEVILDAFYMAVHEVTVGQFKQFMEETGYDYQRNWNSVALQSPTEGFVV